MIAIQMPAVQPSKEWAHKLRTRWLGGEKLLPIQVEMASGALEERWRSDGGRREVVL